VAAICRRLDGLPLALELAAARVKLLSPTALLARLDQALPLLVGGERDLPERQRTLRATLDWSFELLDARERRLFTRLGVFSAGFDLDAAEVVCDADADLDVLPSVEALVGQSLVLAQEDAGGEPRFAMLETIREYCAARLAESGESELFRRRHAAYYLQLAERAAHELKGAFQAEWFGRLEAEHGNLRTALGWYRDRGPAEDWLRLSAALFWFWYARGYWTEGRAWLEAALAAAPERTSARARALLGAGTLRLLLGDRAAASACLDEGAAIAEELGDPPDVVHACYPLIGMLAASEGGHPTARALRDRTLAVAREAGDRSAIAARLTTLARLAWREGDTNTARAWLEENVRLCRELGERWARAHALNVLGDLSRATGEDQRAAASYEESLRLFRELDIRDGEASVLHNLGYVAHRLGEEQRAAALFQDALRLFWKLGDRRGIAECLVGMAGVWRAVGQAERAARLVGAAEALLDAAGARVSASNQSGYARDLAAVRARLGEEAFEARRWDGRAMTPNEAVEYALESGPADSPPARDRATGSTW